MRAAERKRKVMRLTRQKKREDGENRKSHDESRYGEDRFDGMRDAGRISARIIDVRSGLKAIEGVYAVRIHSADFTALIMNDYIPALGKIDGDVTFLSRDGEYPYYGIRGFYKHQHNEFTLLVEEHAADRNRENTASKAAGYATEEDMETETVTYTDEDDKGAVR